MRSRRDWQGDLFVGSPVRDLVPEDHILKRVDVSRDSLNTRHAEQMVVANDGEGTNERDVDEPPARGRGRGRKKKKAKPQNR